MILNFCEHTCNIIKKVVLYNKEGSERTLFELSCKRRLIYGEKIEFMRYVRRNVT